MRDPLILPRLLALPLDARRRLLVPGAGYLVRSGPVRPSADLRPEPPRYLEEGEAWYPCDSAAWMRAAMPRGGGWEAWSTFAYQSERWVLLRGPDGSPDDYGDKIATAPDPIECAIMALGASHA